MEMDEVSCSWVLMDLCEKDVEVLLLDMFKDVGM
jgi:hypothetical protein